MSIPTRDETLETVTSLTWQTNKGKIVPNIMSNFITLDRMMAKGQIDPYKGGKWVEIPLEYAWNNTFQSMGKGGKVAINNTDPITLATYNWKFIGGSMVSYRTDSFKNRGNAVIESLVDTMITNAEKSCAKELTRQMFLDGTGNAGLDIDGFTNLIAENPTTTGDYTTVGGIGMTGNAWWENKYRDMAGIPFAADGILWVNNMINNCTDGADRPNLIVLPQGLYEQWENQVAGAHQIITYAQKESGSRQVGDLGFETITHKRIEVAMEKELPVTDRIYFLNLNNFKLAGDESYEWFELTPWENIPAQPHDRVAYILLTANITCSNRSHQGVMFNVA